MATAGYVCSRDDARRLWALYSDSVQAGWMVMDAPPASLIACVEPFFEPGYDDAPQSPLYQRVDPVAEVERLLAGMHPDDAGFVRATLTARDQVTVVTKVRAYYR